MNRRQYMNGIGVIINVLAVLVGSGFGVMLKGRLKAPYQRLSVQTLGLLMMGFGAYGVLQTYLIADNDQIEMEGVFLPLVLLVAGGALGLWVNMEKLLNKRGKKYTYKAAEERKAEIKRREQLQIQVNRAVAKGKPLPEIKERDLINYYEIPTVRSGSLLADGFVVACLLFCASPFLFKGIYEDCINGSTTLLFVTAGVNLVLSFVLAYVFGSGVTYAAIPLAVITGILAVVLLVLNAQQEAWCLQEGSVQVFIAKDIFAVFDAELLGQASLISAVITIATGLCMAIEKKFKSAYLLMALILLGVVVLYDIVKVSVDDIEKFNEQVAKLAGK